MGNSKKHQALRNTIFTGLMSALSIILVMMIHVPIFPAVPFLEYDPADIPILLVTLFLGPFYGLGMTFAVSIIQGLTVSAQSGWVGVFMHIAATGSFVLVTGCLTTRMRRKFDELSARIKTKITILGLVFGALTMIVVMALWNLFLTPFFMGVTISEVFVLYPFIILFNVIKAGCNAAFSFFIWRVTAPIFRKIL